MKKHLLFAFLIVFFACNSPKEKINLDKENIEIVNPSLVILGIAQDAGFPQAGCSKDCCKDLWTDKTKRKSVVSLGIIDPNAGKKWLIEATPDFKDQLNILHQKTKSFSPSLLPNGIFLTHGHIGHYTGLIHLGREAIGANKVPLYAMPKMQDYLTNNGPWSQLVTLENIAFQPLRHDSIVTLSDAIKVTPFLVPHRDEFTETVGYKIEGKNKTALFIPDIDKWAKWERNILEEIKKVDYAFLDGSFYQNGEIPGRDMRLIPHPFMEESMALFSELPAKEKAKIYFIHFNHTNPVLKEGSAARKAVLEAGYFIAEEGMVIDL